MDIWMPMEMEKINFVFLCLFKTLMSTNFINLKNLFFLRHLLIHLLTYPC